MVDGINSDENAKMPCHHCRSCHGGEYCFRLRADRALFLCRNGRAPFQRKKDGFGRLHPFLQGSPVRTGQAVF